MAATIAPGRKQSQATNHWTSFNTGTVNPENLRISPLTKAQLFVDGLRVPQVSGCRQWSFPCHSTGLSPSCWPPKPAPWNTFWEKQKAAQVPGPLPPTWKAWMEFWARGFQLGPSTGHHGHLGSEPVNKSSNTVFQVNTFLKIQLYNNL